MSHKYVSPGVYKATGSLKFVLTDHKNNSQTICLDAGEYLVLCEPLPNSDLGEVGCKKCIEDTHLRTLGIYKTKSICQVVDPLLNNGKLEVVSYTDKGMEIDRRESTIREWVEQPGTFGKIQLACCRTLDLLKQTIADSIEISKNYYPDSLHFVGDRVEGTELLHRLVVREDLSENEHPTTTVRIVLATDLNVEHPKTIISSDDFTSLEINLDKWSDLSTDEKIDFALSVKEKIEKIKNACDKINDAIPRVRDYDYSMRLQRCAEAAGVIKFFS